MCCVTLISLLAGNIGWIPFAQGAPMRSQLGGAGIFILSAAAFFMAANQLRTRQWVKRTVAAFIVVGGIYILGRLLVHAPWIGLYSGNSTGSLFWLWLVAFSVSVALFDDSLALGWRAGALLVGLATIVVAVSGEARSWASGWLPALVALGVVIVLRWPRLGAAAVVVAVVVGTLAYPNVAAFALNGNEYSLLSRQAAIEIVLRITQASPLIGLGPANY
jgi:hypothetical protein